MLICLWWYLQWPLFPYGHLNEISPKMKIDKQCISQKSLNVAKIYTHGVIRSNGLSPRSFKNGFLNPSTRFSGCQNSSIFFFVRWSLPKRCDRSLDFKSNYSVIVSHVRSFLEKQMFRRKNTFLKNAPAFCRFSVSHCFSANGRSGTTIGYNIIYVHYSSSVVLFFFFFQITISYNSRRAKIS
jgi:hypothetical protein